MKKSTFSMLLALAPLVIQPACAPEDEPAADGKAEHVATSKEALLGGSKVLWPVQDGKATVRVCWLPLDLGGKPMPGGQQAIDATSVIAARKQWVREGVEREWNGKTVLKFVGWEDCVAGVEADVSILPIGSNTTPNCGAYSGDVGSNCVQAIGAPIKGKRVTINLLFGDEAIGQARYLQTVTQKTANADTAGRVYRPAICGAQVDPALLHFNNNQPVTAADIASINAVYKDCLQNMSNHELGHVAGFSHEQDRKDTSAACRAQNPASDHEPGEADSMLGAWDEDSIMSYCRVTLPPTLTAEDIKETNAFYDKFAPKLESTTKPPTDATTPPGDNSSGGVGGGEEQEKPAAPIRKPKQPLAQVEKGGCNGN